MNSHWKGTAIAGPEVPGPHLPELAAVSGDQSLDALSGRYRIFQYRDGHRYSTDDLLVAWYGTTHAPSPARVLDLGSGIGSVGMIAAWRLPGAHFVTVEAQAISVALAQKSARYNGLEGRYEIRRGDFREPGVLGPEERFELILGSPPYFPLANGLHGDHEQKVACRFEMRGTIADYARIASRHLAPGGVFTCIFPIEPPHQAERVQEAAASASLRVLRRRDVLLKEGDKPLLGLFTFMRKTDLPASFPDPGWIDPPLVIRTREGSIHPEYAVIKLSIGFPP